MLIGTYWRQGHTTDAIFQALDAKVGWLRVAFNGEEPSLPKQQDASDGGAQDTGDGFWPDPVWDD